MAQELQDDPLAARRQHFLTESLENSNEPRWGYFGFAGPLAIGDNSYAPRLQKRVPVDDEEPKGNITSHAPKTGSTPDVYFSFAPPLCLDDPFIDPAMRLKRDKAWQLDPDCAFKPAGKVKHSINKLGIPYQCGADPVPNPVELYEKHKDRTPLPNFYTNPTKKGGGGVMTYGVLFGMEGNRRFPEHVPDDYDAARKIRLADMKHHREKLQEMPFKSRVMGIDHFVSNEEIFHCDQPRGIPRVRSEPNFKRAEHEAPFRPTNPGKKGHDSTCSPFPPHMPNPEPLPGRLRRKEKDDPEPPPPWRPRHPELSMNPQPSVVCNLRNMRAERPSCFRRPSAF